MSDKPEMTLGYNQLGRAVTPSGYDWTTSAWLGFIIILLIIFRKRWRG